MGRCIFNEREVTCNENGHCNFSEDHKMLKYHIKGSTLIVKLKFSENLYKPSMNLTYVWLGTLLEIIKCRKVFSQNFDSIIIDISKSNFIKEANLLELAMIIDYSIRNHLHTSVELPDEIEMSYKFLRFLYNTGFLNFLESRNIENDKGLSCDNLEIVIKRFDMESNYRTTILPIDIVNLEDESIERLVENYLDQIELKLRDQIGSTVEINEYMLYKVKRFIEELLDNVLQHAYDDSLKLAGIYINFRSGVNKIIAAPKYQTKELLNEKSYGVIEIYISDLGKGLINTLNVKKLSEAFNKTFKDGIRRKGSPTISRKSMSGLKFIYTLFKDSGDRLTFHNWDQYGTSRIPTDNMVSYMDGSSGKYFRNNEEISYKHHPFKGLTIEGDITWGKFRKNEIGLLRKNFKKRSEDKIINVVHNEKYNYDNKVYYVDMEYSSELYRHDLLRSVNYDIINKTNLDNLLKANKGKSIKIMKFVESIKTQGFLNSESSIAKIDRLVLKPGKGLRKNRIISLVDKIPDLFNINIKTLYLCDLFEEDLLDFYVSIDNMKKIGNVDEVVLSTRTGYCSLFKLISNNYKEDYKATMNYVNEGKYEALLDFLETKDSSVVMNYIENDPKRFLLREKVEWKNHIINGYLNFDELMNVIPLFKIFKTKVERLIGRYDREKIKFIPINESTKYICELVNRKYCKENDHEEIIYIGSVFHSGRKNVKDDIEKHHTYYFYCHHESVEYESENVKIVSAWPFDDNDIELIRKKSEVMFSRKGESRIVIPKKYSIEDNNTDDTLVELLGNVNPMYLRVGHHNIKSKHEFLYLDYYNIINDSISKENEVYEFLVDAMKCSDDQIIVIENLAGFRKLYDYVLDEKNIIDNVSHYRFFNIDEPFEHLFVNLMNFDITKIKKIRFILSSIESFETLIELKKIVQSLGIDIIDFMGIADRCGVTNSNDVVDAKSLWELPLVSVGDLNKCYLCNNISKLKLLKTNFEFCEKRIEGIISKWAVDGYKLNKEFKDLYRIRNNGEQTFTEILILTKLLSKGSLENELFYLKEYILRYQLSDAAEVILLCAKRVLYNSSLIYGEDDELNELLLNKLCTFKNENVYTALIVVLLLNMDSNKLLKKVSELKITLGTNLDVLVLITYHLNILNEVPKELDRFKFLKYKLPKLKSTYSRLLRMLVNVRGNFHNKAIYDMMNDSSIRMIRNRLIKDLNYKLTNDEFATFERIYQEIENELIIFSALYFEIKSLAGHFHEKNYNVVSEFLSIHYSEDIKRKISKRENKSILKYLNEYYIKFDTYYKELINSLYGIIDNEHKKLRESLEVLIDEAIKEVQKNDRELDIVFRYNFDKEEIDYARGNYVSFFYFDRKIQIEFKYLIENVRHNCGKIFAGSKSFDGVVSVKENNKYVILQIFNKTDKSISDITVAEENNKRFEKEYLNEFDIMIQRKKLINTDVLVTEMFIPKKEVTYNEEN